ALTIIIRCTPRANSRHLESHCLMNRIITASLLSTPYSLIQCCLSVFYDARRLAVKCGVEADCALRVLTTVVSTAVPGQCVIDAGSKTLSSDRTVGSGTYGHFIGRQWTLRKLNEEHGYVEIHGPAHVGEKVWVVPSHVCPAVN